MNEKDEDLCKCPCCVRINNLMKESMEKAIVEKAKVELPTIRKLITAVATMKPVVERMNRMLQNGPDCGCDGDHICGWNDMRRELYDAYAALEEVQKIGLK